MSSSKVIKTSVHTIDEKHTEIINEINHNHETVIPELIEEKTATQKLHTFVKEISNRRIYGNS